MKNQYIQIQDLLDHKVQLNIPDKTMYQRLRNNWDHVAKPLDGMGLFEDITARIGAIQGTEEPELKKRAILIMIADNGVVAEGVSQSGQEVTLAVAKSMGKTASSVGKMGNYCDTDTIPVDIGINCQENADGASDRRSEIPGVLNRKVRRGTRNFAIEPAMTQDETLQAIQIGMDLVADCKEKDYKILGTGEMGIGNTTTSAAIAAALLGLKATETAGRGAGLDNAGLSRKYQVIQNAIDKYDLYKADPLTVLQTVGGLDIAGLVGVMIGGACYQMPIVLDGVISVVAGLAASRMFPEVREYLIPSHASREVAAGLMLKELKLSPVLYADLALGEGTGAVMLFPLLEMAMTIYSRQTTFADIEIEAYSRFEE